MDDVVRQVLEGEHGLKIGRRLGRGGMAEVYQAESLQGVPCAVKIPFDPLPVGPDGLQEDLDQLRLVQSITGHPHVVTLMDYWLIGGYLVTRWELSTEGSLADVLAQHRETGRPGLPQELLVRYLHDAAVGIDFLNGQGIYHRDIKPHNLLLFHGRVKLADLGLAKFAGASTASHTGSGTLGYLAPEAYGDHRLSKTVDLYSLAATYLKLRTGQEPFGTTPLEVVERQQEGRPVLDGLPPDEAAWLQQALAFKPEDRPQEGALPWILSRPVERPTPPPTPPVVSPPRRTAPFDGNMGRGPTASGSEPLPEAKGGRLRVPPGVDTLAEAAAAAPEGSVLVLAPGEFLLSQPLKLTKSLALAAEQPGQSRLETMVGPQVLLLTGNAQWLLSGLQLEFRGPEGDVLLVEGGRVQIDQCAFTGGRCSKGGEVRGAGVRMTGTAEATMIKRCQVQGNTHGIVFEGESRGLARGNTCRGNKRFGIWVDGQAQPTLEGNACLENGKAGIGYEGTSPGLATGNTCRGNKEFGIWVKDQAQPTLEGNACLENGKAGIGYEGTSSGLATGNTCRGNKRSGIWVEGQAQPTLEGNECLENEEDGIGYEGTSSGLARGNTCRGNKQYGIWVGGQAQPTLEENACLENEKDGIGYGGTSSGLATGNTCRGNKRSGIWVEDQAQPTLERNECLENEWEGIYYWGTSSGLARGNICRGNKRSGIQVGGQAQPTLEENECLENEWTGIGYEGTSSGLARGNTCRGNKRSGIRVGGQAQPTLEGNECLKNQEHGIAYQEHGIAYQEHGIAYWDKSSGLARGNTCRGNWRFGILVVGQAQPTLEGNVCLENEEAGIGYEGTSSGLARGNTCRRNKQYGIWVMGQAQPTLEGNECLENKWHGIRYEGTSSGLARGNTCRENKLSGIWVDEWAMPRLVRNECRKNGSGGICHAEPDFHRGVGGCLGGIAGGIFGGIAGGIRGGIAGGIAGCIVGSWVGHIVALFRRWAIRAIYWAISLLDDRSPS